MGGGRRQPSRMRLERQAARQKDGAMVFAPEPLPRGQSWPHLETWLLYDTCPTVLPESQGSPTRPRGQGFGQPPAGPASHLL